MKNIEELKKDLYLGDYDGEFITDYNGGYISDVIREMTDNNIDIYNYNLFNWVAQDLNNIYYCDEAIHEFGATDIIGILQGAQALAIEEDYYNNIDDILQYYALNYIQENYDVTEITDEQAEAIEMLDYKSYDKLDEIENDVANIMEDEE